jgi:hypothetical protein
MDIQPTDQLVVGAKVLSIATLVCLSLNHLLLVLDCETANVSKAAANALLAALVSIFLFHVFDLTDPVVLTSPTSCTSLRVPFRFLHSIP